MSFPRIDLRRGVSLRYIHAVAEFSVKRKREEISVLLELAKSRSEEDKPFTPQSIIDEVLIDFPVIIGQRLMLRITDLGLVRSLSRTKKARGNKTAEPSALSISLPDPDEEFEITEAGLAALNESHEIFMPERQSMRIGYIVNQLFPNVLFSLDITKESLDRIIRVERALKFESGKAKQPTPVPEDLKRMEGRSAIVYDGTEDYQGEVRIHRFLENARRLEGEKSFVEFKLELEHGRDPTLKLMKNGKEYLLDTTYLQRDGLSYERALTSIMINSTYSWDRKHQFVALPYDDSLTLTDKLTMKRNLTIESPTLSKLGDFEKTVLNDVPIGPSTRKDAESWYSFLVCASVSDYVTQDKLEEKAAALKQRFPKWKELLTIRKIADLIELEHVKRKNKQLDPAYWFLTTPQDLGSRSVQNDT